jgi:alginate O-acetyltransferase complex protein AlgI
VAVGDLGTNGARALPATSLATRGCARIRGRARLRPAPSRGPRTVLFNSLLFVAFFAAIFLLHWILPHRWRNTLLLLASYVFYASWNWKFLALIWFSTALDFVAGQIIGDSRSPRVRKVVLLVSIVVNLGLLSFFKYYNFFIDSLDTLLSLFGTSAAALHLDIVLPLGISFYTFQTMAYTIDVYRGDMRPVRSLADFALFICFFPQLVAGPIERADRLIPQIQKQRSVRAQDLREGMALACWGLFKKVFVADNLARIVDPVYAAGADPSGLDVLLAIYAFTFQVFADFSAYSHIARGTARMLGFDLMRNFDIPFFSRDHGEWWRRWHISLSTWLRDYLYIPLGGSRRSEPRIAFNLFITMFLSGLWHGSDGTFLVFGSYLGINLILARLYRKRFPALPGQARWPGALTSVSLFALGTVFFRGQNLGQCFSLFGALFGDLHWDPNALGTIALIAFYATPLVIFDFLHWRSPRDDTFVLDWPWWARVAAYALLLNLLLVYGRSDALDFVYFQF